MKTTIGVVCCLVLVCLPGVPAPAPAQEEGERKREKYSAMAYLPSGAGRRMVGAGATTSVDLYLNGYTSDQEAKALAGVLLEGGPNALLKALEKADSKGKVSLTGRVGFYDLKLIRSRPMGEGRQVIAVGDRPIGFLEMYHSGQSRDYEFGILMLNLKQDEKGREKGEGVLIYAAQVKVLDGNKIEIENYGVQPVRLMGVRRF